MVDSREIFEPPCFYEDLYIRRKIPFYKHVRNRKSMSSTILSQV